MAKINFGFLPKLRIWGQKQAFHNVHIITSKSESMDLFEIVPHGAILPTKDSDRF